jgi:hypothetical protein
MFLSQLFSMFFQFYIRQKLDKVEIESRKDEFRYWNRKT